MDGPIEGLASGAHGASLSIGGTFVLRIIVSMCVQTMGTVATNRNCTMVVPAGSSEVRSTL